MSLGTITSRLLGLARDVAMAAFFDRQVTDAWTAAFRLPNLFRRVFGEGSLAVSFIPLFIDLRRQDRLQSSQADRARNLVNGFYSLLLLVMGGITLMGLVWMEPLLRLLLDSNYVQNRVAFDLTLQMARIMFGFVFCIVSYAYFMGILQALGDFAWAALAPAFFNLTMLVFLFLPSAWFHFKGEQLAWGVLIGGLLQALVLVPVLRNRNYFPRMGRLYAGPDLRLLLRRMLPGLLGMGLMQIFAVINLHFASRLGEGVLSAIYWADRLLELPLSLVTVSLSSALLPLLSEHWSRKETKEILQLEGEQLIVNGFWIVPAAVGLYVLAGPLVEVLFFRGAFTVTDLERTSEVLRIYAGSLLMASLIRLLLPVLYACHHVGAAALSALICLFLHILIAPLWMDFWGLQGLILSTVLSSFLHLILVLGLIYFKVGRPSWRNVFLKYLGFAALSLPLLLCPWIYSWSSGFARAKVVALTFALLWAVLSYFGLGLLFRVRELELLRNYLPWAREE